MNTSAPHIFFSFCLLFLAYLLPQSTIMAQADDPVIILSGVAVSGDDALGIPGVHVIVKHEGVGTSTNDAGLFQITVLPGDTITFSHISYQEQTFIVPDTDEQALSILIDMQTDSRVLPMVEIFPFPSEEVFKEAFLALDLTDKREENMKKNLDPQRIARMAESMGMDGAANHRYYMDSRINQVHNRHFAPTLSLLNPFAWAEFIKSIKRGDLKKRD